MQDIFPLIEAARQEHYSNEEVQELADVLTRSVRNTSEAIAMDPLIEKCVIAESCTLAVTGTKTYLLQSWWSCYTCGARGKYGVCATCAAVCHKGHALSETPRLSRFYCDW